MAEGKTIGNGGAPTVRVGVITALLWAVLGGGLAFVSSSLGAPTLSGWLALLAGPVALQIVGTWQSLTGARNWIVAGIVAVGIIVVVAGFAGCIGAMLVYG